MIMKKTGHLFLKSTLLLISALISVIMVTTHVAIANDSNNNWTTAQSFSAPFLNPSYYTHSYQAGIRDTPDIPDLTSTIASGKYYSHKDFSPELAETKKNTGLRLSTGFSDPLRVDSANMNGNGWNSGFMNTISENPGYGFLASLAVPGLGQAANRQWWKTALFVAAEATAIGIYLHRENRGRDGERYYEEFGDEHWSVVKYARYIVNNHYDEHGKRFEEIVTDEFLQGDWDQHIDYDAEGLPLPVFDTDIEWNIIDLDALNVAERESLYANGNPFSHSVEPYGSQQYYELMSKYYQFGPGWRKWDSTLHNIDEERMPEDFIYHARIGYDFNDDLSVARNMVTLLVVNHFVAAFDAYFTQQLRRARLQPTTSMAHGLRPTIGLNYRF